MNRKLLVFFTAISVLFLFLLSCQKIDTTDIGNDLIPVVDNVNTFDTTLEIIADNMLLPDSTRLRSGEEHALGFISSDPIFGKTTASIYMDMRPRVYGIRPFADKDSLVAIDSVVLSMANVGTYGDTNSTVRLQVWEIDQEENGSFKDSVKGYYIGQRDFSTFDPVLAVKDQKYSELNDLDSIYDGSLKIQIKDQMRIRLPNSLGQRFFDYDTSVYKTDSAFRSKFIGFAIRPDSTFGGANALAYFKLTDQDNTKLNIYYRAKKVGGAGKVDSLVTSFTFSNNTNANIIRRNFTGTEFGTAVSGGPANDDKLYMYTSPGSFAKLTIPGLSALNNRVIHLAQFIVEKLPSTGDDKFKAPDVLFLDCIDTANTFRTIPIDFAYSNSFYNIERFGGFFRNNKYQFDISRYVQGIVTRHEPVYELRLYAPYKTNTSEIRAGFGVITPASPSEQTGMIVNPQVANGRAVVAGGNYVDTSKRLRLRIVYSKI